MTRTVKTKNVRLRISFVRLRIVANEKNMILRTRSDEINTAGVIKEVRDNAIRTQQHQCTDIPVYTKSPRRDISAQMFSL
jgi:hypothetical protein